jgi:hypothetical protein
MGNCSQGSLVLGERVARSLAPSLPGGRTKVEKMASDFPSATPGKNLHFEASLSLVAGFHAVPNSSTLLVPNNILRNLPRRAWA